MRLSTSIGSFVFLLSLTAGCASPPPPVTEDATTTRATLAAHRQQQIDRLHAYAAAGRFPHNVTTTADLHMFKDADGRMCAVANLIHEDGRDDLVDATAKEKNDLAIADVHQGAMMDWVLGSGFTQEELARIQLPLPPMHADIRPLPQPVIPDIAVKPVKLPEPRVVALDEDTMKAVIRAHLAKVEAELRANTTRSLDTAVARENATHVKPAPSGLADIFRVL